MRGACGAERLAAVAPNLIFTYFNMDDPQLGGLSQERIALRRAIGMGFNTPDFIRVMYHGQARPANQLLPPHVEGHDASLPAKAPYDPAAARALLDRFGYKDRDGDGFRELPDGKPQVLDVDTIVVCAGQEPRRELVAALEAAGMKSTLVGGADVAAELDAKRAIEQGTRVALRL